MRSISGVVRWTGRKNIRLGKQGIRSDREGGEMAFKMPVKGAFAEGRATEEELGLGDGGTVRLSLDIDRELHRRLKMKAVGSGETMVSMVTRWIERMVPGT